MRDLGFLAVPLVSLIVTGAAGASSPATPIAQQQQIGSTIASLGARDLAFVPTRAPRHYAFESYSITGSPTSLEIVFSDQRFISTATLARKHEIEFTASYVKGPLSSCAAGALKTLALTGGPVYWNGTSAWRCVLVSPGRGRLLKLSATGAAVASAALADTVNSAKHIS